MATPDGLEGYNSVALSLGKLRITLADGTKLPLMYWDQKTGIWEETRHAKG